MSKRYDRFDVTRTKRITHCADLGPETIAAAMARINHEPDAGHILEMLGLS